MEKNDKKDLIKSKQRVQEHGEVFTPKNIVVDMHNLDGIKDESYKVESTFLEPSCGTGNFLVETLERKLSTAILETDDDMAKLKIIQSLTTLYGVDIQADNIRESRERLFDLVLKFYSNRFGAEPDIRFTKVAKNVITHNIILGDFLKGLMIHFDIKKWGDKRSKTIVNDKCPKLIFREYKFNGDIVTVSAAYADKLDTNVVTYKPLNYMQLDKLPEQDTDDEDEI